MRLFSQGSTSWLSVLLVRDVYGILSDCFIRESFFYSIIYIPAIPLLEIWKTQLEALICRLCGVCLHKGLFPLLTRRLHSSIVCMILAHAVLYARCGEVSGSLQGERPREKKARKAGARARVRVRVGRQAERTEEALVRRSGGRPGDGIYGDTNSIGRGKNMHEMHGERSHHLRKHWSHTILFVCLA